MKQRILFRFIACRSVLFPSVANFVHIERVNVVLDRYLTLITLKTKKNDNFSVIFLDRVCAVWNKCLILHTNRIVSGPYRDEGTVRAGKNDSES